jgi:hypothetical protein
VDASLTLPSYYPRRSEAGHWSRDVSLDNVLKVPSGRAVNASTGRQNEAQMSQQGEINAVVAHSILGTIAAVRGAIDTVLAHELDPAMIESLLRMATRRLDILSDRVRDVAMGLPDEVSELLTEIRERG